VREINAKVRKVREVLLVFFATFAAFALERFNVEAIEINAEFAMFAKCTSWNGEYAGSAI